MTAGSGLVHSEFPEQQDGHLSGFQLWVNLASADKMHKPWYRDIESSEIPEFVTDDGVTARVIAGHSHQVDGIVQRPKTEPLYVDLHFDEGSQFTQPLPSHFTALVYVYSGELKIAGKRVPERSMAVLGKDLNWDQIVLNADQPAGALLIAGQPLNEPIAQHGPFVMNTTEELHEAFRDFQAGLFE